VREMAERRPLTAGLAVVPPGTDAEAVRSFITQERKPEPQPVAKTEPAPVMSETLEEASTIELDDEPRLPRKRRGRKSALPVGLIPVTIRLRPEIAQGLKRASLERQLAGQEPNTQQDIVEAALEPWLRREGYLG